MNAEEYLKDLGYDHNFQLLIDGNIPGTSLERLVEGYVNSKSPSKVPITYLPNQLLNKRILAMCTNVQNELTEYKVLEFSPEGDFIKLISIARHAQSFWRLTDKVKINAVLNDIIVPKVPVNDTISIYCVTEDCGNLAAKYHKDDYDCLCVECHQKHNEGQFTDIPKS